MKTKPAIGIATDYKQYTVEVAYLEQQIIYIPKGEDRVGYYAFPSTPYAARLNLIEFRGDGLEDGFRMKAEYRDANVTTYGEINKENMFK